VKKSIAIIGGGPSALLFASKVDTKKYAVTIYEKNKTLGRKFLVAGKGGFNITHSEDIEFLKNRYLPSDFLTSSLTYFTNTDLRNWLEEIGIPTFIGSSKRVYPLQEIKPIAVLDAIKDSIHSNNVTIEYGHNWTGWNSLNELTFENNAPINPDYVIFALGGSSWKITGSDGTWTSYFNTRKITTLPFQASNCAFKINWNKEFLEKNEGQPLKNIQIKCENKYQKGEVVITKFGIEGNAVYALSPEIRAQLNQKEKALIHIDLKPTLTTENIIKKLTNSKHKNTSKILKQDLKLSPVMLGLVKDATSKETFSDFQFLGLLLKKVPLEISGLAPIDEAISTVGGVSTNSLKPNFELKELPNHFCIGEMVNWDAPTGGYLLQGCFSMGAYLANLFNSEK